MIKNIILSEIIPRYFARIESQDNIHRGASALALERSVAPPQNDFVFANGKGVSARKGRRIPQLTAIQLHESRALTVPKVFRVFVDSNDIHKRLACTKDLNSVTVASK